MSLLAEDIERRGFGHKKTLRKREVFLLLFISILVTLPIYNIFYALLGYSPLIIQIFFFVVVVAIIRRSGISLQKFGLNTANWKRSLYESLFASILLMIPLLKMRMNGPLFNWSLLNWSVPAYIIIAMFQEFLMRGVSLTAVEHVFPGRHHVIMAIVITAALFAAVHIYFSPQFAVAAFVCGLVWGWLYTRHRTIIGIGISHFLVGNFAYLTGAWDFLLGR